MRGRISVHDLDFADLPAGKVFGPLECPSSDAVRDALLRLAHRYPDNRLFATVERTRFGGARWGRRTGSDLEQFCVSMVSDLDGSPDPDELLHFIASYSLGDELAHYWVGKDYIASTRSHLLGDTAFSYITPVVLRVALGEPVPALPEGASDRLPLTRAALSYFGRRPTRLVAALRNPRPRPGHSGSTISLPSRWAFTAVGRTATDQTVRALRAWRDATCPSVSLANVWAAAIRASFDAAGVEFASPGFHVLVNARRYVRPDTTVRGNFVSAMYVEPSDPCDPEAVSEVVRRDLDSGRPLLAMATSGLKQAVLRRRPAPTTDLVVDRLPTLTVSYVGDRAAYEVLPADRSRVAHYSAVRPEGPSGITVICSLAHGRMSVSVSFCEAVVARAGVMDALDRLVKDPIGLVTASRAARPGPHHVGHAVDSSGPA